MQSFENGMRFEQVAAFEVLEDRRLLSASPLMVWAQETAPQAAVQMPLAAASYPKVAGTYNGNVTITGMPQGIPVVLKVLKQTGNKISGTISAAGAGAIKFSAKIDAKGKFTAPFNQQGASGTIRGQFVKNKCSGTLTVSMGGQAVGGTFALTKG